MDNTTLSDVLATLRLPELWARFEEAYGYPTRCPNKRWLTAQLLDAYEAQAEAAAAERAFPPADPNEPIFGDEPPAGSNGSPGPADTQIIRRRSGGDPARAGRPPRAAAGARPGLREARRRRAGG